MNSGHRRCRRRRQRCHNKKLEQTDTINLEWYQFTFNELGSRKSHDKPLLWKILSNFQFTVDCQPFEFHSKMAIQLLLINSSSNFKLLCFELRCGAFICMRHECMHKWYMYTAELMDLLMNKWVHWFFKK